MAFNPKLSYLNPIEIEQALANLRYKQKDPFLGERELLENSKLITMLEEEVRQRELKELQDRLSRKTAFMSDILPEAVSSAAKAVEPILSEAFFIEQAAARRLISDSIAKGELRIVNIKGKDVTEEQGGDDLRHLESTVAFVGPKAKEVEMAAVRLATQLKAAGLPVAFYESAPQESHGASPEDLSDSRKVAICIPVPKDAPPINLFDMNLDEVVTLMRSQKVDRAQSRIACVGFGSNEYGMNSFLREVNSQAETYFGIIKDQPALPTRTKPNFATKFAIDRNRDGNDGAYL